MIQVVRGGCSRTRLFFARLVQLTALALALTVAACSSAPPLATTFESPEDVARAVLDALRAGDRIRLDALALSEQEFKDHVWPELPAARPERNLPFSYVWGDLHQKSDMTLTNTIKAQEGHRYELQKVTFEDTTPYASYRIHRKATFHVRDASGREGAIRVCGSMIEKDGAWKVFSYVVDD